MAVSGYGITLNKTCNLGLSTSTSTYETGSNTIFTVSGSHGSGYISLRATVDGMMSGTTFVVRNILIQLKKSGSFSEAGNVSIGSCNASSSGFRSFNSSKSYPKGSTILVSQISTSWTTVAIISSGNSIIDSYSSDKSASVNIYPVFNYDRGTAQSSNIIKLSFNAPKIKRTLTYLNVDGSQNGSIVEGYYGKVIQIKSGLSSYKENPKDNGEYTVVFNANGGIVSPTSKQYSWSWSQTINYTFNKWGSYSPGQSYTMLSDNTLKASFNSDVGDRIWVYRSLGSLPTAYKKGYQKTNFWNYSNGNVASQSDQVTSSFTLYAQFEPQSYKIAFNLNGGQMPEDMGKISDYTTDKTYGANSARTPNFAPLRLGYKFIGWSDQTKSITPIGVNEFIPDTFYNAINTEYTNNNVTLYAQWEYNVNTVKCVYYLTDSGSEQVDTHTYNIDTATLDPQGDKAFLKYAPNQLRSGDFVFLGWLDAKPDGWDTLSLVNNGYHGTYTVPPEKVVDTQGHEIEIELPIDIKIKNYKDLNDWGIIETYYGIWAKTGKYMKINGSWKKVNKCFVKINGIWKTVTDIWTKQNGSWKHEI